VQTRLRAGGRARVAHSSQAPARWTEYFLGGFVACAGKADIQLEAPERAFAVGS
jgi:hypothetical protein